ncbi:F0F1 ATP synthase subunit delta [Methylomonas sp. MS20]|uniref:F0F1 ATP synthase subunit delta n=1 Tax=unclassified Methylomonas TaxID=2608980 RepID=UPI0028A30377|nr:F0F1 ATP synthase subunit delta [Methylomonas sp. MV1]MDT4332843.1 F0F1 ATP synthase subunit delta [Methylomonas sp. MV1]
MAELATLARPYAEAVFKRAKEGDAVAAWSDSLAFLSLALREPALSDILNNPRVGKQNITNLVFDICGDHVLDEAKNLIKILIDNDKLSLLPQIATMFEQHKADDEGYINVDLYSAYALSKAEQGKYVAMLEKVLNKKVNAAVSVDKSLIGGILARAGDKVIDGSVRGQLHQLAKRL